MSQHKNRKHGVRIGKHRTGLLEDLENPETYGVKVEAKKRKFRKDQNIADREQDEDNENGEINEKLTEKVLKSAKQQQDEINKAQYKDKYGAQIDSKSYTQKGSIQEGDIEPQSSDEDSEYYQQFDDKFDFYNYQDIEQDINQDDAQALEDFMPPIHEQQKQQTLADLIMAKIEEGQGIEGQAQQDNGQKQQQHQIDASITEVYSQVGDFLSRYTVGKIPKAFKYVPNLRNWEEIVFMTHPENWSPHAVFAATRLFISSLNEKLAQRFLSLVLLPYVRRDIQENKKLHFMLFQALRKATYKPGAFFKGVLIPLCRSGTCNLREAVILSALLKRVSLPMTHASAALFKLSQLPYAGTTSFFIKVLLDKKYALPYRLMDELVDHFIMFEKEEKSLPVIWHQCLLTFIQRYKNDIRNEDKERIRKLLKKQYHYQVTQEIYRELDKSKSRGEMGDIQVQQMGRILKDQNLIEDETDMEPMLILE